MPMDFIHAILLGITEGLTEFLPISSTGHMILLAKLMQLQQSDFLKTFEVAIQFGSILAVAILFFEKLKNPQLIAKLILAFIPTGFLGLTLYPLIKNSFHPTIVAYMLIFGGIVFLIIEYLYKPQHRIQSPDEVSYKQAFFIGIFQSLAIIPGTSRSGSSIIGGLLLGLSRKCSAEFSFLLAIPTIFAATGYDLYKNLDLLDSLNLNLLLVGSFVSFLTALCVIKLFLKFITAFGYGVFGIYRIFLGSVFLFLSS